MNKPIRQSERMNRRVWSEQASIGISAMLAGSQVSANSYGADVKAPLNRYPRMLHDWYGGIVHQVTRNHDALIDGLKTKADAEKYVETVRMKIRHCFGEEPPRTPLNSKVTGVVERDGYRIEKVVFESRPGFPVTANLYIPTRSEGRFPGVVGSCGHSMNGKAAEAYQAFSQGLARLGFVCFVFDPIGQGERFQYEVKEGKSVIGAGVNEHLHAGNQQFLVGEFFGSWRAWDGIRALDYLLTRKEVDPNRVGITGNSGGGTLSTWLCGLDRRWTMAAPACFITSFQNNFDNELPADTEQCPPQALALGLDHCDFLVAMAPKPVIILAKEKDFFDVRGAEKAYEQLKKIYRLLGAEENIALFVGPTDHGYSKENREAMYSWFITASNLEKSRYDLQPILGGELKASRKFSFIKEPSLVVEKDDTLWCTTEGQVANSDKVATVFTATREKSRLLSSNRPTLTSEQLITNVKEVLRLPVLPTEPPDYRIWSYLTNRNYPAKFGIGYSIVTELGIESVVYHLAKERLSSRPHNRGPNATLYVSDLSSDNELRSETLLKDLIADDSVELYCCDVRGTGESQPDTCGEGSFLKAYGSEYFYSIHGLMLNRPLLGGKTFDLLRVLQWLQSIGYQSVHLVAKGRGTLPATFAGLISPLVRQVTLSNSLSSFSAIAEAEYYELPLVSILPNVLASFDLPECYRELEVKKLKRMD